MAMMSWSPFAFRPVIVNPRSPAMMRKTPSPSRSPRVFRPVMLNQVVGDAGHHEHVTPLPLRVLAWPHGWRGEFTVHVVPITLPAPSGSGFYSHCKAWDSGLCSSSQWADGGDTGRDVKLLLGSLVWRTLSVADRGHHRQCRTGGPLQV